MGTVRVRDKHVTACGRRGFALLGGVGQYRTNVVGIIDVSDHFTVLCSSRHQPKLEAICRP